MEKEPPRLKEKKNINKKKVVIIVVVVIILLGAICSGAYRGYASYDSVKKQRDDLSNQVSQLESNSKRLETQNQELTTNLEDANKQLKEVHDEAEEMKSSVLTVSVTGTTKDSRGYVHQRNNNIHDIIVDLTVKNESKTELYFSIENLKLKDEQNKSYTPLSSSCWPPAANKQLLKSQLLAPGETITGSVCYGGMFNNPIPATMSTFIFQYGEVTTTITAKDATYPTWQ